MLFSFPTGWVTMNVMLYCNTTLSQIAKQLWFLSMLIVSIEKKKGEVGHSETRNYLRNKMDVSANCNTSKWIEEICYSIHPIDDWGPWRLWWKSSKELVCMVGVFHEGMDEKWRNYQTLQLHSHYWLSNKCVRPM